MLKILKLLRKDQAGVVSFEYVIVAAAIVGAVALAFGTAGGVGNISAALNTGISAISAKVTNATTP